MTWQIVPRALTDYLADANPAVARRVAEAMYKMVKLDIAQLQTAARG